MNVKKVTIEKNVPIPERVVRQKKIKPKRVSLVDRLAGLQIGECAKITGYKIKGVGVGVSQARKKTGHAYTMRTVEEHGRVFARVWRIEPKETKTEAVQS